MTEEEYVVTARTPSMSAPGFYTFHSKNVAEHWAASIRKGGGEASVRRRDPGTVTKAENARAYVAAQNPEPTEKERDETFSDDDRRREEGKYHWVAGYSRADGGQVRSHLARNPQRRRR
jgi:hypothetical protein